MVPELSALGNPLVLGHQLVVTFDVVGVFGYAVDRAHLLTLGLIEMPYAFRAEVRIDDKDLVPSTDGVVGAFGFTNVTVDAVVGDIQGH